ncbi:copper resistance system multicopper oxidase [Burkholderia gladioli]|uniref:copper resistance system multicopper oxidase n=1 Tax=Burkholderia gladioli TaxID=28095 RepID=UPI00203091A4|nr:copper resistance system multicopper oxidase [Burkholderia gladioli]URV26819.1 copper resistance system multicopper oxidase [Burkholderia gladioli]
MHTNLGRRNFVTRLCAAGVAGGLGMWRPEVWALEGGDRPRVLAGSEFDLAIARSSVEIGGRSRRATTVNGTLPGPVLRWREGDTVTLRVANRMDEASSIHWHGIVLPSNMDGVPGLSFDGIAPGSSYTYRFKVRQHGTYWYHSHSSLQEQTGVYGPLIIDPAQPGARRCERDYVVMLSDWSDEDPRRIKSRLKKQSNYYNFHQRTLVDLFRDARRDGWRATLADRRMWSAMRMSPTDLSDVGGYTYTYLVNGAAPDDNWTGLFNPGERVRLRFINASAMSYFDVRIPGLRMTVVAADGQDVEPVAVDEFRIAVAETYDVVVEPGSAEAYTIFAQSMDRSGYARATLARREGLAAPVPALDTRPLLTMADMGMDHGAMAGMSPDAMQGMDHGSMAGMSSDAMQGMDHGAMARMSSDAMQGMDHGSMAGMSPDTMQGMDHGAMAGMIQHPVTERGNPLVDAQAMAPTARLDDPGVGLRDNGRRVLTYADLRSVFPDPDGRSPMRSIELHLTGHMEKFAWSFNGLKFSDAGPIRLRYGERVRLVLVNDTMMAHPIHLHGMWSDLEDEAGRFQVRKHTIDMPPGTRRSYRVTADALGRWAYHCHLLFHMETGMFREVVVEE